MSEHTPDDVAESIGGAYWSVDEGRWETIAPALPDHVVDLLAPPILVGAAPCGMLLPAARNPRVVATA